MRKLTYRFNGRDYRLTDVAGQGSKGDFRREVEYSTLVPSPLYSGERDR